MAGINLNFAPAVPRRARLAISESGSHAKEAALMTVKPQTGVKKKNSPAGYKSRI